MNWNQPKCEQCWENENPNREAVRVIDHNLELCSTCARETYSGIYVRQHPDDVNYPKEDE